VSEVRRSAVRGLAWTSLSYSLREAVKFLAGIVVARLLVPRDFGVFALASLAIALLALVRNLGFAAALVRDPDLTEAKRSTAFWTNAALGAALAAAVALAAPPLADWFGEPRLRLALWILAPTFLLDSLSAVHDALLERARDYRRRALRDSAATLLGTAVALGLAFAGAGWLALVLQRVVAGAASVVFLWSAVAWRPTLTFDRAALSGLLHFGLPLAGWTAMTWLTNNVDSLLVGRLLGPVALGTYTLAYSVARGPGQLVQAVLGGVLFPEFSRIQHDLPQVRHVYVSSLRHILAALLLPLAAMAALAPTFVPLVYGPQWTGAVPLVQLFAIVAIVPIATTTAAWLYTSQGRTRRLFWTGSATTALLVGLAVAYAVVSVAVGLPVSLLAARLVGLRPAALGRAVAAPVLAWLEALAILAVVQAAWPGGGWWMLALAAALAAPAYLLVLHLVDPGLLRSMRRLRHDLRGTPAAAAPAAQAPPLAPGASATLETAAALAGPGPMTPPAPAVPQVVRFRLGHAPDVGWLAGLPGITPLQLRGDLFTARVADPRAALRELQAAGFPEARIDDGGDDADGPDGPAINV
jgi:O-antigen/teichoic acid export membrane protein